MECFIEDREGKRGRDTVCNVLGPGGAGSTGLKALGEDSLEEKSDPSKALLTGELYGLSLTL